jgi:hypothetical protein
MWWIKIQEAQKRSLPVCCWAALGRVLFVGLEPKASQAFGFLKPNLESLSLEMGRSLVSSLSCSIWSIVFCTATTYANLEKADMEASI